MSGIITTVRKAGEFLGVHPRTIQRYISAGIFPEADYITPLNNREIRSWKVETLEEFRDKIKPVGNPNFKRKGKNLAHK